MCGDRQVGPKLANQIKRLGFYSPTVVQNTIKVAKACETC